RAGETLEDGHLAGTRRQTASRRATIGRFASHARQLAAATETLLRHHPHRQRRVSRHGTGRETARDFCFEPWRCAQQGQPAVPGALPYIAGVSASFELDEQHPEGERRAALAKWLSDKRNPLTW